MSSGTRLRVIRRPLEWSLSPADVLRLVRSDAHPVALCGAWAGGGDVIAAEPVTVRSAPGQLADVFDGGLTSYDGLTSNNGAAFGGGWIGYLGYSAAGEALAPTGPRALPAWWFGYYDNVLRRDRASGEWHFEALWTPDRADALEQRFTELTARAAGQPAAAAPPGYQFSPFRLFPGPARHQEAVRQAVEYIRQGDIFQANITLRAEAAFTGDPLDAFCQGVTALNPPYAAFIGVAALESGRAALASLSPELFLRRDGDTVTSKPIKGTARRSVTDENADAGTDAGTDAETEAAAQRAALEDSAKNRAENVMIVDLVRNDLSRVCVPGSVTVPVLLGPEAHPGVWHLVSTVTGTLSPGAGDGDLLRATFPPGSVTGAPKVRALEIIDELETGPREAYTGAIGYRSPAAGLELNVAIRTFEFAAGRAWIGAGGGIVADSDPLGEYAECLIKAAPLLAALGARLDESDVDPGTDTGTDMSAPPPAGRALAAQLPRPAAGVFTSLLVTNGETRDLPAHLARLAASVRALYGKDLPATLPADLASCLRTSPSGRLRLTVRPVGGPLQATVEVVPLKPVPAKPVPAKPVPAGITLRPATVPGGLGPHKYRDRRLLAALTEQARLGPDEQLLLTDETGEILETDRANVFAVSDGVLLTPPADGRIVPGTARDAVLRAARAAGIRVGRKPLTLDELAGVSEVFVSNAVVGLLPVAAVGGLAWRPGPVTATLAQALAARAPDARTTETGTSETPAAASLVQATPSAQADTYMPYGLTGPLREPGRPLVILIDNYDSFTFNLAHLLAVNGAHVEVVRNDEVTAAQVIAAAPAGVVISPGPCAPAEAGISVATVTACAQARVPLLGICLGHQAIGAAFGARIVRAPSPVHGKAFPVTHDGGGVLAGLPSPFQATRYHSLILDEATLPRELAVTARTGISSTGISSTGISSTGISSTGISITGGITMGVRHRTRPIEGVQFHPESILTTHGSTIVATFVATATHSWAFALRRVRKSSSP
jgi:para-aminobenzoate synthetase / 4-amino-4-deoxychorismate lyase